MVAEALLERGVVYLVFLEVFALRFTISSAAEPKFVLADVPSRT